MAEKKGFSGTKLFLILLLIALIGGGAAAYWFLIKKKEELPHADLAHVKLNPEILSFAAVTIPNLYNGLLDLNNEVVLIDREIERLDGMAREYPQQRNIIFSEKKNWERLQKKLTITLNKLESSVEMIYVSYSVNREKGMEVIDQQRETILAPVVDVLDESRPLTERLKTEEKKTLLDTIKEKFS